MFFIKTIFFFLGMATAYSANTGGDTTSFLTSCRHTLQWSGFPNLKTRLIVSGSKKTDPGFVTFEQFGAKGNGSDETAVIQQALDHAKAKRWPVHLLDGKTYKYSPRQTTDITGIPGIFGTGTIDVSDTGPNAGYDRMHYIFTVSGKKKLLQPGIAGVRKGNKTLDIGKDLNLKAGDILFISSLEPLPNNKRPYNRKGQRVVVEQYTGSSGKLVVRDSFYFTIRNAYLWKNEEQPSFEIGTGVRFITSPMNLMSCIQLVYARGIISGYYENFALAAIYFRSSEGMVRDAVIKLPVTKNNGYSYGIAVSDMSAVSIKNCSIEGGRHTVCGTSGGLWTATESGGRTSGKLGYPASLVIDGGEYKTTYNNSADLTEHLGTIDSHGSVYDIRISNCKVYGGISLGADYARVDNVTIYPEQKRAFNFGSDVLPGSAWGHYTISNVTINLTPGNSKSVLFGKSDIEHLDLQGVTVNGADESTLLTDFKDYAPKEFTVNRLNIAKKVKPKIWVNSKTRLIVEQSSITQESVRLIKRDPQPVKQEQ